METVATNIRIDKQLKEQSSQVLEGLGLSLSGAIN
ncbi:MAG: type II toxin-antitoxin system RelB/DinJ family antitoxin, partial [Spirochaetia bacterium]|nr:type II toxin-antitoxin system RelB/DinJ family antitoxin [Spirochaetia bacterium]